MAEIIEADIQILGNLLQVTPKESIEDNAQYEIRIKDFDMPCCMLSSAELFACFSRFERKRGINGI